MPTLEHAQWISYEPGKFRLHGKVSSHPKIPNGEYVTTTEVIGAFAPVGATTPHSIDGRYQTRNTIYNVRFGTPPKETGKWRVKMERILGGTVYAKVGDIVYDQKGYDYGLAKDDSYFSGQEHITVTKNSDGSTPGFTIPKSHLEIVPQEND